MRTIDVDVPTVKETTMDEVIDKPVTGLVRRAPENVVLMPVMDVRLAQQRLEELQEFCANYLQESKDGGTDGGDYGIIPGAGKKKVLFKSGAEKLCDVYGLADRYTDHFQSRGLRPRPVRLHDPVRTGPQDRRDVRRHRAGVVFVVGVEVPLARVAAGLPARAARRRLSKARTSTAAAGCAGRRRAAAARSSRTATRRSSTRRSGGSRTRTSSTPRTRC